MSSSYFLQLDKVLIILQIVFVYKYMLMINAQVSNTEKMLKICMCTYMYSHSRLYSILYYKGDLFCVLLLLVALVLNKIYYQEVYAGM